MAENPDASFLKAYKVGDVTASLTLNDGYMLMYLVVHANGMEMREEAADHPGWVADAIWNSPAKTSLEILRDLTQEIDRLMEVNDGTE